MAELKNQIDPVFLEKEEDRLKMFQKLIGVRLTFDHNVLIMLIEFLLQHEKQIHNSDGTDKTDWYKLKSWFFQLIGRVPEDKNTIPGETLKEIMDQIGMV